MNEQSNSAVHWSFWLIGALCLVWNALGCMAYIGQTNPEFVAALPDAERLLIEQRPVWATAAFAIAVWGGALGCVVLLLRKSFAFYLLLASLLGVAVQMVYNYAIANSIEVYGPGGGVMSVMIVGIGVFLLWYTKHADGKGWLS